MRRRWYECEQCEGTGKTWHEREGEEFDRTCYGCWGSRETWKPGVLRYLALALLIAWYCYACNGCHL